VSEQNPSDWTSTRLIDHIKATHHRFVRANAAQTGAYARRIADVHGDQHPELFRIAATFDGMATELTAHLAHEEEVLFPAIKRAEAAGRTGAAPDAADAEARRLHLRVRLALDRGLCYAAFDQAHADICVTRSCAGA
jgi:regulator of cell morphogenesis and NO signaling